MSTNFVGGLYLATFASCNAIMGSSFLLFFDAAVLLGAAHALAVMDDVFWVPVILDFEQSRVDVSEIPASLFRLRAGPIEKAASDLTSLERACRRRCTWAIGRSASLRCRPAQRPHSWRSWCRSPSSSTSSPSPWPPRCRSCRTRTPSRRSRRSSLSWNCCTLHRMRGGRMGGP